MGNIDLKIAQLRLELEQLEQQKSPQTRSSVALLTAPPVKTIDTDQASTIEECILFLCDRCDGAREKDKAGFNGYDAKWGKWLASLIKANRPLHQETALDALERLKKYEKTQLESNGYKLPLSARVRLSHRTKQQLEHEYRASTRSLILSGQFVQVRFAYDAHEVQIVKDIYPDDYRGAKFQSYPDKHWLMPLDFFLDGSLYKAFSSRGYRIDQDLTLAILKRKEQLEADAIAEQERNKVIDAETETLIKLADLENPIANGWTLFRHQREAVEFLLHHRRGAKYKGAILADDMGLGKTVSALKAAKALAEHVGSDCEILVVAPKSVNKNWLKEAGYVGANISVFSWAKQPQPLDHKPYIVIADECHYAQNLASKRTKSLLKLCKHKNCKASWLLTGTPMKNGKPENLYPLLKIIEHELGGLKKDFTKRYCMGVHEASNLDELHRLTSDVMLRRVKNRKNCPDLPPKQRSIVPVDLSPEDFRYYEADLNRLKHEYQKRVKKGEISGEGEVLVEFTHLRRVGSKYKAKAAIKRIQELRDNDRQVVVFTEFIESAQIIRDHFKDAEFLRDAKDRQALVERFQSGQTKIFVSTIKAGGVGLTLTSASDVILVDRPWTPGDAEQAEDRSYRIGQDEIVTAYWMQLGEIDQKIDNLIQAKQQRISLVLSGRRKTMNGTGYKSDVLKIAKEALAA